MKSILVFLLFVACACAQSGCGLCHSAITDLATTIDVCGADDLHTYRVADFNVISFTDIIASQSGDIEGRAMAGRDLILGGVGGYSIGDKIVNYPADAPYVQRNYSAIAGRDVSWTNGQLNPNVNDATHRIEYGVYWGSSGPTPAELRFGRCGTGSLDLSAIQTDLRDIADSWAGATPNVDITRVGDVLELRGPGSSACDLLVRIPVGTWNLIHGFSVVTSWNYGAHVIVDFDCTDEPDIFFRFGDFPGLPENIIYNFGEGCADTIIDATSITGSLLAPYSTLHQTDGRILGNVYVNLIEEFRQVNVIDCPSNPESCDCCGLCPLESKDSHRVKILGKGH